MGDRATVGAVVYMWEESSGMEMFRGVCRRGMSMSGYIPMQGLVRFDWVLEFVLFCQRNVVSLKCHGENLDIMRMWYETRTL